MMGIPIWDSIVGPVVNKVLSFIPDPEQKSRGQSGCDAGRHGPATSHSVSSW